VKDIAALVNEIVALVAQHPEGLRAEQIREALSLEAKELPRPLNDAVASGRLKKSGQKRATTYFVKGRGASARQSASANGASRGSAGRGASSGRFNRVTPPQAADTVELSETAEMAESVPAEDQPPAS